MGYYFAKRYWLASIYDYEGSTLITLLCGRIIPRWLKLINKEALYVTKLFLGNIGCRNATTKRVDSAKTTMGFLTSFTHKMRNTLLVFNKPSANFLGFADVNKSFLGFYSIINSIDAKLTSFRSINSLFERIGFCPFNFVTFYSHMIGGVSRGMLYVNRNNYCLNSAALNYRINK